MRIILPFVGLFLALVSVAMATYPGGNWLDRHARGHDLARNFLCDLLDPVALNGLPNPIASGAAQAALAVLAVGLTVTWWLMPLLLAAPGLSRALRTCALVSLLGLVAIPLTPPSGSHALHAAAVLCAGVPAIGAWVLTLYGLGRQAGTRALAAFGAVALLSVVIAFALYASALLWRMRPTLILPLSHRAATLLSLGWLVRLGTTTATAAKDSQATLAHLQTGSGWGKATGPSAEKGPDS